MKKHNHKINLTPIYKTLRIMQSEGDILKAFRLDPPYNVYTQDPYEEYYYENEGSEVLTMRFVKEGIKITYLVSYEPEDGMINPVSAEYESDIVKLPQELLKDLKAELKYPLHRKEFLNAVGELCR